MRYHKSALVKLVFALLIFNFPSRSIQRWLCHSILSFIPPSYTGLIYYLIQYDKCRIGFVSEEVESCWPSHEIISISIAHKKIQLSTIFSGRAYITASHMHIGSNTLTPTCSFMLDSSHRRDNIKTRSAASDKITQHA